MKTASAWSIYFAQLYAPICADLLTQLKARTSAKIFKGTSLCPCIYIYIFYIYIVLYIRYSEVCVCVCVGPQKNSRQFDAAGSASCESATSTATATHLATGENLLVHFPFGHKSHPKTTNTMTHVRRPPRHAPLFGRFGPVSFDRN